MNTIPLPSTADDPLLVALKDADPLGPFATPATPASPLTLADALTRPVPGGVVAPLGHERQRGFRRPLGVLAAAAAVAAVLTVAPALAPHRTPPPGGTAPLAWLPNASAAELERFAAQPMPQPLPDGTYLYTRIHVQELNSEMRSEEPLRRWYSYLGDTTSERWRGSGCDEAWRETSGPWNFPTEDDRQTFERRILLVPAEQRDWGQNGHVNEGMGHDLDAVCTGMGTAMHPNAAYAATLPTEPGPLVERLAADLAKEEPAASEARPVDGVWSALERLMDTPWLSETQRRAAVEALGRVPGVSVIDHRQTPEGEILVVRLDGDGEYAREFELSTDLPMIRNTKLVLTAPKDGLPAGTVIRKRDLLEVRRVASMPTFPRVD